MIELPIISDCNGCGVCCTTMGTPPGFARFFPPAGRQVAELAQHTEDHEIVLRMPVKVFNELRVYYTRVQLGLERDRTEGDDLPCLWYDAETRRCKHHKHRPTICRDFEVGSADCLFVRNLYGIQARGAVKA